MQRVLSPGDDSTGDRAEKMEEAASAGLVIQALAKADRGFSIYLPNNPLHEKFFADFCARTEEHLGEFGALRLGFTHDSVLCGGETIYTNPELRENLAFRMYADGIRALKLEGGVERPELRALVEILALPAVEDDEDDIVTRLWSSDLPHVTYVLAEMPPESGAAPLGAGPIPSRAVHEGGLRRYAAELAAAAPPPPRQPPSQQIFSLSEQEVATLQELLARDERRTPLEDMASILEAVIAAERDVAVLEEFLEIVARLCGDLMITGHVDQAVELLSMLARVSARPGLPPGHVAKIADARSRVVTADVLAALSRQLATGDGIGRELLRALVAGLGSSAIEPFCRILGDVSGKETRKVLIDALVAAGRGSPELFLPFLVDTRWYLVRNTIYILRRIAGPEAARAALRCAGHQDPRVRKEVLLFFDETGDPAGESVMIGFLGDEVQSLRVAAVRSLARRGSRAAAERLLDLTAAAGFAERERLERESVWEALAALAPDQVLPTLRGMLLKRRWFKPAQDLDDTACACAGLRRIGTPEVVDLLQKAAAGKRGEPRELVEKALRSIAQGLGSGSRAGAGPDGEPVGG
jgi:hypothetical protein